MLSVTDETLERLYVTIAGEAQDADPLAKWYELVSFINVRKRDDLRGKALFAQTLYEMAYMLKLFYTELYDKNLHGPHEGWGWREENFYGQGVTNNTLEHLTYLTNRYHLNPKPKLILVLEGKGEFEQIPPLVEHLFGYSLSKAGVETQTLLGIGNFEGSKRLDRFSALEKFIDDHHARQTPVFLVLDKEGRAERIVENLLKAKSKSNPERQVTKPELIHLWERSIEFDNFTDEEIAQALCIISGSRHIFTLDEVAESRAMFGASSDPLSKLYRDRLDYGLNKTILLKTLFDSVFLIPSPAASMAERPIIKTIQRILSIANSNHQPTNRSISDDNQQAGLLG